MVLHVVKFMLEQITCILKYGGWALFYLNNKNSTGPGASVEIEVIMITSMYQDI